MGIVYAATNKSHKGIVKIGWSKKSAEERMKDLNSSPGVLQPFICLCALDAGDRAKEIETLLHKTFKKNRKKGTLSKEVFRLDEDSVLSVFSALQIAGFKDATPREEDTVKKPKHKRIVEERSQRRANFTFRKVGIRRGTTLQFKLDDEKTCKVVDNKNNVLLNGKEMSLSRSASFVLEEMGVSKRKDKKAVAGTLYWCYKGKTLDEVRKIRKRKKAG